MTSSCDKLRQFNPRDVDETRCGTCAHRKLHPGGNGGRSSRIFAQISGKDVPVDMAVTNFRAESRQFDCVAMAPGHATQQRSIGALTRGQTIVKRFRFTNAANLLGKRVRVTLREIDGSHVANYETVVR